MAEHVAEMQIAETAPSGIGAERKRARLPRISGIGVVAAALVVLLIAGVAIHDRRASHAPASVAPQVMTRAQSRLIENNTTNLPNAVAPDVRPTVVTREQQRFLEVNTMLPTGGMPPYAEDVTPLSGHPR